MPPAPNFLSNESTRCRLQTPPNSCGILRTPQPSAGGRSASRKTMFISDEWSPCLCVGYASRPAWRGWLMQRCGGEWESACRHGCGGALGTWCPVACGTSRGGTPHGALPHTPVDCAHGTRPLVGMDPRPRLGITWLGHSSGCNSQEMAPSSAAPRSAHQDASRAGSV